MWWGFVGFFFYLYTIHVFHIRHCSNTDSIFPVWCNHFFYIFNITNIFWMKKIYLSIAYAFVYSLKSDSIIFYVPLIWKRDMFFFFWGSLKLNISKKTTLFLPYVFQYVLQLPSLRFYFQINLFMFFHWIIYNFSRRH